MDYPSLSEIGGALNTVFNPFGPTIDPASMVAPGGPDKPRDDNLVKQFMSQDRSPIAKQYEDWAKQHPYMSFAAEQGAGALLNELPYGSALRKAGLGNIADVLDLASQAGKLGGFNPEYIKDPRYSLGKIEQSEYTPEGSPVTDHSAPIHSTTTGDKVGELNFSVDHDMKEAYINMWKLDKSERGQPGQAGHMLHLADEAGQDFPDLDRVRFMRTTGGGPKNKGYLEEVTLPTEKGREAGETMTRRRLGKDPYGEITPEEWGQHARDWHDAEAVQLNLEGHLEPGRSEYDSRIMNAVRGYRDQGHSDLSQNDPILSTSEYTDRVNQLRSNIVDNRIRNVVDNMGGGWNAQGGEGYSSPDE